MVLMDTRTCRLLKILKKRAMQLSSSPYSTVETYKNLFTLAQQGIKSSIFNKWKPKEHEYNLIDNATLESQEAKI